MALRRPIPTRAAAVGLSAVGLCAVGLCAVGILLSGCSAPAPAIAPHPGAVLPPAGARFDYQLGGASPVPAGATIVVRDSTEEPAPGAYGICYVNGFQTQPGAVWPEDWLVHTPDGDLLVDPNWPDEHVFDLSTSIVRQSVATRMAETIAGCAAAEYEGIEFDNLDSWTRSGGAFDADDAVDYAALLVESAHREGLATAQKNTGELGARGRDEVGFDFAITEECDRFDECASFTRVYGDLVFDIEYTDDLRDSVEGACARAAARDAAPSVIVRDRDLAPADAGEHFYRAC